MAREVRRPRWTRWDAEQARRVLSGWRASGLPLATYAREQGLSAQRLRWWRDRLKDWSTASEPTDPSRAAPLAAAVIRAPMSTAPLTVHLPDGVRVDVAEPEAVPAPWLAALVAALSEPA